MLLLSRISFFFRMEHTAAPHFVHKRKFRQENLVNIQGQLRSLDSAAENGCAIVRRVGHFLQDIFQFVILYFKQPYKISNSHLYDSNRNQFNIIYNRCTPEIKLPHYFYLELIEIKKGIKDYGITFDDSFYFTSHT